MKLLMVRFSIFAGICSALFGCAQRIDYAVENSGMETLSEVTVKTTSGHVFEHGVLVPKSHKSYSGEVPVKAGDKLTISWKDSAGKGHSVAVDVRLDELRDPKIRTFRITPALTIEKGWLLDSR